MYGYFLLHGKFLHFMGGEKFEGIAVKSGNERGHFKPRDAILNFIVPSEPALRSEMGKAASPRCHKARYVFSLTLINVF